ncbi:peptidoglycan editing factor PgeF [Candidatus Gottesmanbacteria bacterium]|nr:peptidoglycan editing factor PgeF [Candidatus Gottesmanbacteria bacterium]
MLKKTPEGFYQSTLLTGVSGLLHGYTTRAFGGMKNHPENRRKFFTMLGISTPHMYYAGQVHGNRVVSFRGDRIVEKADNADGLIVDCGSRAILGVFVADCVPILFVDPMKRLVGTVHAGWRGTLGGISTHAVSAMEKLGSDPSRLLVSVGPYIHVCCYDVPKERADKFKDRFDSESHVAVGKNGKWFLDLGQANRLQLIAAGVAPQHIEKSEMCTSCNIDEFFSYRKDSKETFGEIMGIIGFST